MRPPLRPERTDAQRKVFCPNCGTRMILKTTQRFTYPNGDPRKFFACPRYPMCKEVVGAHPDGTPLGFPVDKETRTLRSHVHELLIASGFDRSGTEHWLTEHGFGEGHVAKMNRADCLEAIRVIADETDDAEVAAQAFAAIDSCRRTHYNADV